MVILILFFDLLLLSLQMKVLSKAIILQLDSDDSLFCNDKLMSQQFYDMLAEGAMAALSLSGTMLGYYPVRVLPSKTAIAPVNPTFLPRVSPIRDFSYLLLTHSNTLTHTHTHIYMEIYIMCTAIHLLLG